jgi:hypothetical protein
LGENMGNSVSHRTRTDNRDILHADLYFVRQS